MTENVKHSLQGVIGNENADNEEKDCKVFVNIGQLITRCVKIPLDVVLDMVVEVGVVCCEEEYEAEQERRNLLLGCERSGLKSHDERELKVKWRAEVRTQYSLLFRYK